MTARKGDDEAQVDGEELSAWDARRKRIFKEALRETLIEFGLDPSEPLEIQKDMAHLRRQRKLSESAMVKFVSVLIGIAIPGIIALVVSGIQRFFTPQ